jgi:hypothetical protein
MGRRQDGLSPHQWGLKELTSFLDSFIGTLLEISLDDLRLRRKVSQIVHWTFFLRLFFHF